MSSYFFIKMKISIITVTFNAEKFILKTVQSVLNQTFSNIEYIIVDGNSKDKTVDIIKNESKLHTNIKWISEPDSGLYDAMNKGMNMATGDFVWFINAGDKIYSNSTAQHIADFIIQNPDCDIVYGQTKIIDLNDNICGERHKIAPDNLKINSFLKGMVVCHQSFLVRLKIAPFYDLRYKFSSDFDWVCNCVKKSKKICYINEYLSLFMTSGISSKNRKNSLIERFNIMKYHFGIIKTFFAHLILLCKYPFSKQIN